MTKAATPCSRLEYRQQVSPRSLYTQRHSRSASLGSRYYKNKNTLQLLWDRILSKHIFASCDWSSDCTYYIMDHAGSSRSWLSARCQLPRREHAANIWPSLCWPWMPGWVKTSRNALETSLRGQTRGSVCVGSDVSDWNIYDEARNRIHARNGETEETTEVVSSPLLVYIDFLALLYILHA